jgi:hypothetical protein
MMVVTRNVGTEVVVDCCMRVDLEDETERVENVGSEFALVS